VDEIYVKRMEVIRQLLPTVKRVGILLNTSNVNAATQLKEASSAARALGLETEVFDTRDAEMLRRALEAAAKKGTGVLVVSGEGVMFANRQVIVDFAAEHQLPVMYASREFVDAGGLVSYGVHYPDLYYRAATYIDKILKGVKPGDLPIERPNKLELIISQKAATPLGIVIPRELLFRADEVIR
jgi:putative ABC transport system substrate-binding protein